MRALLLLLKTKDIMNPNNYYTIYAVGLLGKTPALESIAVPEPRL